MLTPGISRPMPLIEAQRIAPCIRISAPFNLVALVFFRARKMCFENTICVFAPFASKKKSAEM